MSVTPTTSPWRHRFTVFIPTYNRAYTLPRAFASIERQVDRDLEVVIVDDGSTDDTRALVEDWQRKVPFPVRYHHQPNQGKHVAHNTMLGLAQGEFVVLLDSDDMLLPNALERFRYHWDSIPAEERGRFAGVEGLCRYLGRDICGSPFPRDVLDSNHIEVRIGMGVGGEKRNAIRTDVLRQFPYPVFPGERHIRPSLLWDWLAQEYKFRFFNEVVQILEHQPDGLSANRFRMRIRTPRGLRLCIQEEIRLHQHALNWRQRLRLCTRYTRYSLHAGVGLGQQWRDVSIKGLWTLSVPWGALGWLGDQLRKRAAARTSRRPPT